MEGLSFFTQGSSPEPYEITFVLSGGRLAVLCTCQAGATGKHCKHRTAILLGSKSELINPDDADFSKAPGWLKVTPILSILDEFVKLSAEEESLQNRLKAVKKKLATAMFGRAN